MATGAPGFAQPVILACPPESSYGQTMNRDSDNRLDLADARRALRHRIDGHRAALRTAEALGWPGILRTSIDETEARLDEARACLLAVDLATLPGRVSADE